MHVLLASPRPACRQLLARPTDQIKVTVNVHTNDPAQLLRRKSNQIAHCWQIERSTNSNCEMAPIVIEAEAFKVF